MVYRSNEDRIGMFLEEETEQHEGQATLVKDLYSVYRTWAEDMGMYPMSQPNFIKKLAERGEKISGTRKNAQLDDRTLTPKVAYTAPSGDANWASLVSQASRF
jgi:phage/plasmid-associated DNA primase